MYASSIYVIYFIIYSCSSARGVVVIMASPADHCVDPIHSPLPPPPPWGMGVVVCVILHIMKYRNIAVKVVLSISHDKAKFNHCAE